MSGRWKHDGKPHPAGRLLDFLYPPLCGVCSIRLEHGETLCTVCDDELPRLRDPFCSTCGESFDGRIDGAFDCVNCRGVSFAFEFARPALIRDDRGIDLIHRLKYGRELHLSRGLGTLATEALADPRFAPALAGSWPLVPVPLHRSRLRERGFNQAEEISRILSKITGLPVEILLRRTRRTDTQTALGRRQRMENLRGAFAATRQAMRHVARDIPGAVVVDDVLTTGSTVHACAKALRDAGVPRVFVVTVMRG